MVHKIHDNCTPEIELHASNINREDGFSLSRSWKPLICNLREQKYDLNKNITHFPYFTPYPSTLTVTCLKAPYWSIYFFPYFLSLIGPFTSAFLTQTLHKSSTSQFCHVSSEDGDSMFLWHRINLRNQTTKPQANANVTFHTYSIPVFRCTGMPFMLM
jgi:hypothetical protein